MTSYIAALNQMIVSRLAQIPNMVLYGENINNGSHIVGMTRNLKAENGTRIINVGNCEATHVGVGFGLMLNGVSSVLFAKQMDFMLLGLEHFVNTYNFIRARREAGSLGSFTVCVIVCDQGFQGPQSSFNGLGDICSMARVPGHTLTNLREAEQVIRTQFDKPGFRVIALSQRLFQTEILDLEVVHAAEDSSVFQYSDGSDASIVCFNFSLPEGHLLRTKLEERGIGCSLFSVHQVFPPSWERIKSSVLKTRKLVVLDDSKSANLQAHTLLSEVAREIPSVQTIVLTRGADVEFGVCPDQLQIDYDSLIGQLLGAPCERRVSPSGLSPVGERQRQ